MTGDAARVLGLSPDRVRQLERAGAFGEVERTPHGVRVFALAAVERLAAARALRPKARGR